MTTLATPERRELGNVAACLLALVPALMWAIGFVAIQGRFVPLALLMVVASLLCPGWVAWAALRARSELVVVLTAVLVTTGLPASQLVISGGSQLERVFFISLTALAILVGIVAALKIMRAGGKAKVLAGSLFGAVAMILVLMPLLFAILLFTR